MSWESFDLAATLRAALSASRLDFSSSSSSSSSSSPSFLSFFFRTILLCCGISWDPPSSNIDGILEDLDHVERIWCMVKATIADAEERAIREEPIWLWLRDLRDLAYMMEDVHDLYEYQLAANQVSLQHGGSQDEKYLPLEDPCFWKDVADRVVNIKKRFDDVARTKEGLSLGEVKSLNVHDDDSGSSFTSRPHTGSLLGSKLMGRDGKIEELRKLLHTEHGDESVEVIALVGIGGVGKTSLAQHTLQYFKGTKQFDTMAWVFVSEHFNPLQLLRAALVAFTEQDVTVSELSVLQDKLRKFVRGKKFFLVMDDIWNRERESWDTFFAPLVGGEKGSKILITTREEAVAHTAGAVSFIKLGGLSDEDGWSLFQRHAFINPDEEHPPKLVDVGKNIVKKCGGLPLAIKILGRSLRSNRGDQDEWMHVLGSDLWDDVQIEQGQQILGPLYFSYLRLPTHLKACFRFCSFFRKGEAIDEEELIELWMAHNLIKVSDGCSVYEAAERYIHDLESRSFFEYETKSWTSKRYLKIHDLLFDILQYISGYEFSGQLCCSSHVRHVRVLEEQRNPQIVDAHNLRTLDVEHDDHITKVSSGNSLRLLHIQSCSVLRVDELLIESKLVHTLAAKEVTESLFKLYNLKYLYVSGEIHGAIMLPEKFWAFKKLNTLRLKHFDFTCLPESLVELTNLEVLDVRSCSHLKELPRGITNLIKLRSLRIEGTEINYMPSGISRLKQLRDLDCFPVGNLKAEDGHASITELKNMSLKRDNFELKHLENVTVEEAKEFAMASKRIRRLYLSWSRNTEADEVLWEELRPHSIIENLEIDGYGGINLPTWTGDASFVNLTHVKFSGCQNCTSISSLRQLLSLENLDIKGMAALTEIISVQKSSGCPDDELFFPKLKTLCIQSCGSIKYVPVYRFPSLVEFSIMSCEQLSKIDFFMGSSSSSTSQVVSSSLKKVRIGECLLLSITSFQQLQRLPFLTSLHIFCIPSLTEQAFVPPHDQDQLSFPKLEYLWIDSCENIAFLNQHVLFTSMRNLQISDLANTNSDIRSNRYSLLAHLPYLTLSEPLAESEEETYLSELDMGISSEENVCFLMVRKPIN